MKIWEKLAAQDATYEVADYERAAYTIAVQQALHANDKSQAVAYRIVTEHLEQFREVLSLIGLNLHHHPDARFVVAIPKLEPRHQITKELTLLVLTLRRVYDQQAPSLETDTGNAVVTIEELRSAHKALTAHELPDGTVALKALLTQAVRMGFCKLVLSSEGSYQPWDIAILPSITALVGEHVLRRLLGRYTELASKKASEPQEEETAQ